MERTANENFRPVDDVGHTVSVWITGTTHTTRKTVMQINNYNETHVRVAVSAIKIKQVLYPRISVRAPVTDLC